MSLSLSVVIVSRNCEARILGTVKPWLGFADEVIVVDQFSTDKTAIIAKEAGCTVFQNSPENGNFDLNRKLGFQKAKGQWIFYIDTDERPTPELLSEMSEFLKSTASVGVSGVKVPNQFYFIGAPLKYGLYNPRSAEFRLFRQNSWTYNCEDGFHRGVSVTGKTHRFKSSYKHFNVNSLSEWFQKTNQYTEHDAVTHGQKSDYRSTLSTVVRAVRFFFRHYFLRRGFRDGTRGFISIFYFTLYHMTLDFKRWEKRELAALEVEKDYLKPFDIRAR